MATVDMFNFFALDTFYDDPSQVAYFNPRVIYDSLHGRWLAMESSYDCFPNPDFGVVIGSGYIDVAVSDSADPTGGWTVTSFGYADYGLYDAGLGTSTDKVVVAASLRRLQVYGVGPGCVGGYFHGTDTSAMAWSQLTSGQAPDIDSFRFGDIGFDAWQPAVQTPATTSTVYLVGVGPYWGVHYATLTGNPASGSSTLSTPIDLSDVVSNFSTPPRPRQPGTPETVTSIDMRPTDAVWQGNHLAVVSTLPCDPSVEWSKIRDCVRVTELSTATSPPSEIQDFLIGEDNADNYKGGVGYAGNGDLHVVWTRSSENPGDYPSSYTAHHRATDEANELSEPQLLKAGVGTYPGYRWGDYVGVAQDPQVPNAVWQANQYSAGDAGWGTHVSQLQTGGSSYVPITPLRVVDSRIPTGVSGIFTASQPRTFAVAGVGTIPTNAIGVTGNVTVTGQQAAGFVSITPTATSTPPSSTMNFPLGDTRANNFTTSLDATGKLAAVYKAAAGKKSHVIVDITGYFVAGDGEATYTPMAPVRALDTRPSSHVGQFVGTFSSGTSQMLLIAGGETGVPPNATAVTANLTVVGQTRPGYLSVTPNEPTGIPASSSLNFPTGDVRANGLTAVLNDEGGVWITYAASFGGKADVILDVTGYYVNESSGFLFYPLNPGRILDTRGGAVLSGINGAFVANSTRYLDVSGRWGVDIGARAITGNLTVVNQSAAGYVTIMPTAVLDPGTSTLNFPIRDIRANGVSVSLLAGHTALVYRATAGETTHLLLDVTGYFK